MLRVEINSAFAPPPLIFRSFDLLKFSFLLMTFRMSAAAGGANAEVTGRGEAQRNSCPVN
jgi:hypothetical protein